MKNCPNCGAVLEPYKCRCEYCGTWYFDLTAFDMSGNDPYYIKFRTPYGILMTLAKPEVKTVETTIDTCDCIGSLGQRIATFTTSKNCDIGVVFHSIPNENGDLFTLVTSSN